MRMNVRVSMRPSTVGHRFSPTRAARLSGHDGSRARTCARATAASAAARRTGAAQVLGARHVGHEATADVLQPGDRVAVRDDAVGGDAHHAQPRIGPVEAGDAAVGLQPDAALLQRDVVVLDEPTQEREGDSGLVEASAGDDAGDVEPARVLAVLARDVDAQAGGPRLHGVDLADQLLEPALVAAALHALQPAAPRRRRPFEHLAEELDAIVERQRLEDIDPERLEQAARHVEVLLVGRGVAAQGDHLRAGVEGVRPLVDRRDPGAQDDVAPSG